MEGEGIEHSRSRQGTKHLECPRDADSEFPGFAWSGIVFPFVLGMASLGEDLLGTVNKLQDLVFNTIGNDSLDLPQIVRLSHLVCVQKGKLFASRASADSI